MISEAAIAPGEGSLVTDNAVVFACFESGGRLYGVDVLQIREIVRSCEVTPLPRAPELIEGVVDLRGAVIPVIDLARALTGRPAKETAATRIAVLEVEGMAVGLRVEAAVDVLSVDGSAIGSPPALATQAGYDAVRAVVRRPDATPVLVLSLEHLLESLYRSALEGRS
jgi:purine-binding chemotaxis protein CheW